jgi:hypothetical protein
MILRAFDPKGQVETLVLSGTLVIAQLADKVIGGPTKSM